MKAIHRIRTTSASRRGFLQNSILGAAVLGGLSIARGAHAEGKEVIKIGMVGSGSRCSGAASHAMQAARCMKLAAMCDLFPKRVQVARKNLKKMYPDQVSVDDDRTFVGFDGYQKVIDSVDVVLIACASKFHPMYAEAAVKAGKHGFTQTFTPTSVPGRTNALTVHWVGNEVVGIEPRGGLLPMFGSPDRESKAGSP